MDAVEKKLLEKYKYTSLPWIVLKLMAFMERRKAKRKKV